MSSEPVTADSIRQLIESQLSCVHIDVHGDGRHWFATIVSGDFDGLSRVKRHQRVYACLGQRMHNDEIHALSMSLHTPQEWAQRS